MPLHNQESMKAENQLNMLPLTEIFNGTYRIANKNIRMNENGTSHITCELHDASGMKLGRCHPNAIKWYQSKPFQLVNVKGYLLHSDSEKWVNIISIEPNNDKACSNPLLRLPKALCADPANLDSLIKIRDSIHSYALGKFLDTVFSDEEIAMAFIQVPASRNYHHNHTGGLLAHSVEVANIVANEKFYSNDECEIAIVAALLHDIGKVKTFNTNRTYTKLGKMVGHDNLTLEVCSSALKELDETWPDASYTMRHVWTCASPGARYGFQPMCLIATSARNADNQSCINFDIQKAYQSKLIKTGLLWTENQQKYYWRPAAEPRQMKGLHNVQH
ncbi:MAG: HD domain-containing protein [Methylotenera sp.]